MEKTFNRPGKPVYYCVMAGAYTALGRGIMENNGLCTFDTPERAVMAAKNMCIYAAFRARHKKEA
jgi:acyl-CoA synthetase (NDP forming)